MKNVLITNAVPSNNGDAALVFSLYDSLIKKGFDVKIACQHYNLVKGIYKKEYPIVPELAESKIIKKIPYNKYIKPFLVPFLFLFNRNFLKAKVIISAPGGYMNSYYGFDKVLATLFFAKLLGKKTAIYAQSFGPLNDKDIKRLRFLSKYVDVFLARDRFSFDVLRNIKISPDKFTLVEDGAFLIPYKSVRSSDRKVAVSVRSWKHDGRDENQYVAMIKGFVEYLVGNGYKVEFLSTCQGLKGYRDDSIIAEEIFNQLDPKVQGSVFVNKSFYRLNEFLTYLSTFQLVIGTRLHMCITSMLRGIPSLNISYEVKGKEVYDYLDLNSYSIDYNADSNQGMQTLKRFLDDQELIVEKLDILMPEQNSKANVFFENFLKSLKLLK